MKRRLLVTVIVLLELLVPRQLIAVAERFAFENPGEHDLRPWTVPAARVEALCWLALAIRGGWSHPVIRVVAGICGALMAVAPRRVLEFALDISYEDAEAIELRPWVTSGTRSLGVTYLRFALRAGTSEGRA